MKLRTKATYQFLDQLTDAQYEALRADMAANGIRHSIVVDEKGLILDGHHRARAAAELEIDPPYEVVEGLDEQEKRDLVFTLNGARRHMDTSQLREFVVKSLMADPQLSDRQHARRTGVSHPTVAKLRAELEAGGQLESLTSRVGADGRSRPASQPTRDRTAESEPSQPDFEADPAEGKPSSLVSGVRSNADEAEGAFAPEAGGSPGPVAAGPGTTPRSDPRAAVREAMDRHLPPDHDAPHRDWRDAYLGRLGTARTPTLVSDEEFVEHADEQCFAELRRFAEDVAAYFARIEAAWFSRYGGNVTPIRNRGAR